MNGCATVTELVVDMCERYAVQCISNRLEQLPGDRKGQFSIRINQQYRVCFVWKNGNAHDVGIVDYHKAG